MTVGDPPPYQVRGHVEKEPTVLTPDEKRKLIDNLRPFHWVQPFAAVKVEAGQLTELCDMAQASLESAPSGEGALRVALADAACILDNFSRGGGEQDVDDAAAWIDKYAPQYSDQALAALSPSVNKGELI